jgi:hypothetical protein
MLAEFWPQLVFLMLIIISIYRNLTIIRSPIEFWALLLGTFLTLFLTYMGGFYNGLF